MECYVQEGAYPSARLEGPRACEAGSLEYIEVYYNPKRIQKALGYLSPSEFELGIDMTMALVA